MSRTLQFRLSVMMFLHYSVIGAILPIMSHYLKNHLQFEPFRAGVIISMYPLSALFTPFIAARIADKYISAEKLIALCHLLAGIVMWILASQTSYRAFLPLYFLFSLLFMPTLGLSNTVLFHHMPDAQRQFGGVRLWGTFGWVVAGWALGFLWLRGGSGEFMSERLPDAFRFSALASWVFALYALSLPKLHTISAKTQAIQSAPPKTFSLKDSLKFFTRPDMLLICMLAFFGSMAHQYFYYGMSPFLSQSGIPDKNIMPIMGGGQISEMICLGLLALCLSKLGMKQVLVLGGLAQCLRSFAFACGEPMAIVYAAIPLHGPFVAAILVAGSIYIDKHCSPAMRNRAQQLFTTIYFGCGYFVGSLFAGKVAQFSINSATNAINFRLFWSISGVIMLIVTVLFALMFKERKDEYAA